MNSMPAAAVGSAAIPRSRNRDPWRTAETIAVSSVTHIAAEGAYAAGGAIVGAAIGTCIEPGGGSLVGAAVGSVGGGILGGFVADQLDTLTLPMIWSQ